MNNKETAQVERLQQALALIQADCPSVSLGQLILLLELAEAPGITQGDLMRLAGLHASSGTHFVDIFSSGPGRKQTKRPGLGWIEAQTDPDDRKKVTLRLSKEGERVLMVLLAVLWPE